MNGTNDRGKGRHKGNDTRNRLAEDIVTESRESEVREAFAEREALRARAVNDINAELQGLHIRRD